VATSIVSPSITARTNTGSERRNAVVAADKDDETVAIIANAQLARTSRNFIAISFGAFLTEPQPMTANHQPCVFQYAS
jgi:hypothetical protein